MTTAEQLKREGKREGKIEVKQEILIKQMSQKFGLSKKEEEHIKLVNIIVKLDKAIDKIISAESKEAVLKYLK